MCVVSWERRTDEVVRLQPATTQWEDLQTSVHFKQGLTGREHIAQCTTCHGSHGIRRVTDPASSVSPRNVVQTCSQCHASALFMRSYNPAMPVDQRDKYLTSVHGMKNKAGDTKVAECASCHGSHAIRSVSDARSLVYRRTFHPRAPGAIQTACA